MQRMTIVKLGLPHFPSELLPLISSYSTENPHLGEDRTSLLKWMREKFGLPDQVPGRLWPEFLCDRLGFEYDWYKLDQGDSLYMENQWKVDDWVHQWGYLPGNPHNTASLYILYVEEEWILFKRPPVILEFRPLADMYKNTS
jgi:hypothetical protein